MHTSQQLRSSHFEYRRPGADGRVDFSAFCAQYHDQDRVCVVSPRLEDGVLHTAYALLALTTAFYDVQRATGSDFFIYPQHFAIIGQDSSEASRTRDPSGLRADFALSRRHLLRRADATDGPLARRKQAFGEAQTIGIATGAGCLDLTLDEAGIGGAWAWLDVWPKSNWFTATAAPTAMLKKVFDLHINRLFWPQNFTPKRRQEQATESGSVKRDAHPALPDYARRILKTRLKSVYYYNTSAPTVEICAAQPAVDIVQLSLDRLPEAVRQTLDQDAHPPRPPGHESYRQVGVDEFLEEMEACFTT